MTTGVTKKSLALSSAHALIAMTLIVFTSAARASSCEDLMKLQLDQVTITKAEAVAGGTFTPPGGKPIANLPAFCRVVATIKPTADSDIRVEEWLPESGWNERIVGTGNGGLAGSIAYGALANGVRLGYAVANTDMGMATPPGENASIFVNRPERWADWGYRATHEMTVLAKQLVSAYYTRNAKEAYFVGCSTGGEQALMEAQRFPDDYNGIVGGAAASNRTGVHVSILWNFVVPQRTPASSLSPAKTAMLSKAVVDACDELDGVKDGLISDPPKCNFDPGTLECKQGDRDDCLTALQVETVRELYSGPVDPRTGQSLYPGLAKGSEVGWDGTFQMATPNSPVPFAPVFQWVFGLNWDWRKFDFDHDVDTLNHALAGVDNATSPDLDLFRAHGHKLLEYQGWSDSLVPPGEAIKYYDAVATREAMRRADEQHTESPPGAPYDSVDGFYRLFMVPGMEHCGSGPGPSSFDALTAVQRWVEQGIAPDSIVASKTQPSEGGGTIVAQRLLCPYPRIAQFNGRGRINDASSYACVDSGSTSGNRSGQITPR